MPNKSERKRLIIMAVLAVALIVITITQGNPPFFLLLPILLFTLIISWYLYTEIHKDNEEALERGINYLEDEKEAQQWMKRSFVPRVKRLAKKEMRLVIVASGFLLVSFIFLWSFFVGGFITAIVNTIVGLLFFVSFLIYALYTPKEFKHIFKRVPRRYRHHNKNDWVHAYLLLFPFAIPAFFILSLTTTGEGVATSLINTVIFLFYYTIIFISMYCLWFLYKEYQKEREESLKKTARKILKEN